MARAGVALLLLLVVGTTPMWAGTVWADRISLMAIWGIIGLSVNIIVGYAGQISLGHQAFVGIGAFTAAYVIGPHIGGGFVVSVVAAGLMGAILAFALGLVALRVKGLYFALVTLSFGLMAEFTMMPPGKRVVLYIRSNRYCTLRGSLPTSHNLKSSMTFTVASSGPAEYASPIP